LAFALAACSSGSGSGANSASGGSSASSDAKLQAADGAVLAHVSHYVSQANACKTQSSPVVCLESADRTLGGQIHDYANLLAVGKGFSAPPADLTAARNQAQTLANSLEILGDAQPTQQNYDQVLNTFSVPSALSQLRTAVMKVQHDLG
jgi:hypothetical protein